MIRRILEIDINRSSDIIDAIGERRSEIIDEKASVVTKRDRRSRVYELTWTQRSVETFDSFCWFVSVTFRRSSLVPRIICLHLDRHFFSFVPSAWNKTFRHLILLTVTIWYCICKALIIIVERCPVHWTFLLIRVIDPRIVLSILPFCFEEYAIRRIRFAKKILRHRHFSRFLRSFVHFIRTFSSSSKFMVDNLR